MELTLTLNHFTRSTTRPAFSPPNIYHKNIVPTARDSHLLFLHLTSQTLPHSNRAPPLSLIIMLEARLEQANLLKKVKQTREHRPRQHSH